MCLARPMLTTCLTPYPSDIPVLIKMWRLYTCGSYYYALPLGGALSDDTRLTSVCLTSLLRLTSVAYIRPAGGRHMRPAGRSAGMARIGSSGPAGPAWLKAAAGRFHCRGRGHIVAASRTAFFATGSCRIRQRVDRNFIPGSITHHLVQQHRSVRKQDLTRTT